MGKKSFSAVISFLRVQKSLQNPHKQAFFLFPRFTLSKMTQNSIGDDAELYK